MTFETKASAEYHTSPSGMKRSSQDGKLRIDLLWPKDLPFDEQILVRFAAHMARAPEAGIYEERNWETGVYEEAVFARAQAAASRHLMQWMAGLRDEDHAAAVMFNLMLAEYQRYWHDNPKPVQLTKRQRIAGWFRRHFRKGH